MEKEKNTLPFINILTRTSNRPLFFKNCVSSIRNQSYKNIRHIVSVDDNYTYQYVRKNGISDKNIIRQERKKRTGKDHFPYNLYMNKLLEKVEYGWILFLDDDNILFKKDSLEIIINYILDYPENKIIIWRLLWLNNIVIPKVHFGKDVCLYDIDTNCFLIHSSIKNESIWDENKSSDFRFIKKLYENYKNKTTWINNILTKVGNKKKPGRGMRNDL